MPILYYVPIIHSVEDYGSLGPAIQKAFAASGKKSAFEHLQEDIKQFWELAEKKIEETIKDMRGLVIYHDGFPTGDREKVMALFGYMIKDHPESPNFRLVKKLLEKGALLEGTEDIELLKAHLELYRQIVEIPAAEQEKLLLAMAGRSRELTGMRDEFIAKRIRDTLPSDGKGILFIGRDHDVMGELEKIPEKFTVFEL